MNIRLKWNNRNTTEDGTRVYRTLTPIIDTSQMPAPIATLAKGASEYIDNDVVRDTTYYYRLGVFKGTQESISSQITAVATRRTGPGPQFLKNGDLELGYYGTLVSAELFSGTGLSTALGYTEGSLLVDDLIWLKFAYKGKTLFVPLTGIRSNITWNGLYNKGLVYGTNDNGKFPTATPTNQYKTVTKGNDTFLVRLMTGGSADPDPLISAANTTGYFTSYNGSEWDTLMPKICSEFPPYQQGGNWEEYAWITVQNSLYSIVQETIAGAGNSVYQLSRGSSNNGGTMAYVQSAYSYSKAAQSPSMTWRPVLELLP